VAVVPKSGSRTAKRVRLDGTSPEVAYSVNTRLSFSPNKLKLGIVSRQLSTWIYCPPAQLGGAISWCSFTDRDVSHELLHGLHEQLGISFKQEKPDQDWHAILRRTPVNCLVFDADVRAPRQTHPVWTTESPVDCVITSHAVRGALPPGWSCDVRPVIHSSVGGITDWCGKFFVYRRRSLLSTAYFWDENAFQAVPGKFADLVVDVGIGGSPATLPNAVDHAFLSGSSFSLSTWRAARGKVRFKLPHRFAPSGYVRRPLAPSEALSLYDVPGTLTSTLSPELQRELSRRLNLPLKAVMPIARSLGEYLRNQPRSRENVIDNGDRGGYLFGPVKSVPVSVPPSNKRSLPEGSLAPTAKRRCFPPEIPPQILLSQILDGNRDRRLTADEKERFVHLLPRLAFERFSHYHPPLHQETTNSDSAAKADNSAVPVFLWDDRLAFLLNKDSLSPREIKAIGTLRRSLHACWVKRVSSSWWKWWNKWKEIIVQAEPIHWKDIRHAGLASIRHARSSNFWEWCRGSAVFFWRWKPEYVRDLALGVPPMWVARPPTEIVPQKGLGTPAVKAALADKLSKMRTRDYITPLALILATMNYFAVPKADDWRPVYDGTKSGLNDALWIPWFYLPDLAGLHRCLDPLYWQSDNDYGEMFNNFWLAHALRKYSGVDLTPLFGPAPDGGLNLEAWNRISMGSKPSPYIAVQQGRRLKRDFLGNPKDSNNVFRWEYVELNLPGAEDYAPARPWISKRRRTGEIAADAQDYVDDIRCSGPTEEDSWQASSKVGKTCSYKGCQNALRKYRAPSQEPGAWAGAVVGATSENIFDSVTVEKWTKARSEIARLREAYDKALAPSGTGKISSKLLEQVAGYLNHIGRAYKIIRVYLNGIYATLNSWRPDRDEEGWKTGESKVEYDSLATPTFVDIVLRLGSDIHALEMLTNFPSPPQLPARPSRLARPRYIFGDASGAGYGVSDFSPASSDILVDFGLWESDITDSTSSNQREFLNIVLAIEALDAKGELNEGTEFWIFTDNYHAEACFYKGGGCAKTQAVLNLMLRLQKIQMKGNAFIHIVWVSGKRMIAQGTDGLSRGDLTNGVMRGMPMLEFVPLHKSAIERQPQPVSDFLRYITAEEELSFLSPEQWYTKPLDEDGVFVWAPPPAIADAAVIQLAEAIHVRPWNTHLILIPTLMTSAWRKTLSKASDIRLTLPFDNVLWPKKLEHEKLTLAICFPLLARNPWRVKRSPVFDNFHLQMRSVQGEGIAQHRNLLRKFWLSARALQPMPSGLARSLLPTGTL
jgi:hypothetical protein